MSTSLRVRHETKNFTNQSGHSAFDGKNVSVAYERSHPIILRLRGFGADNTQMVGTHTKPAPYGKVEGMPVTVEIAKVVDDEVVAAFNMLIPQLSSSNPPPTREQLQKIVSSDATFLLLAKLDGRIVGSLTLALFQIPTGLRAWIEDVVVDGSARGTGVGEALNTFAINESRSRGATTVDLTSRPSREAANRLYQRLGFVQRDTNVYRFTL